MHHGLRRHRRPDRDHLPGRPDEGSRARTLLICITVRAVNAEGAPNEKIFDPRAARAMGLTRDERPGHRDGSDPFAPAHLAASRKK